MKRKLLTILLTLVLVIGLLPIQDIKAEDNVQGESEHKYLFDDMSADEIVDCILESCKGLYPKEGQSIKEWYNYAAKKLPFLDPELFNVSDNKVYWMLDPQITINTYNTDKTPYPSYIIYYDFSNDAKELFHSSETRFARSVQVSFYLSLDAEKADIVYDKLATIVNEYYATGKDDRTLRHWTYTINGISVSNSDLNKSLNIGPVDYPKVLIRYEMEEQYNFVLLFVHPDDLVNPTEFAESFFNYIDSPVIDKVSNKKSKKVVVKYTEDCISTDGKYVIQYSTNKKFKNAKDVETEKTSITLSKLKKNKKYYIRVKYIIDGQSSEWSEVKSIKIKK